ncbi:MAG: TetR/AcrR family transcriptional regulator, partial [Cyclobacteriaceae bacterium]
DVLRNVTDLFWQRGYNGTSMQDLVDVTGLNRSSIYNSFGDKFQLFEESLKYYQKTQNNLLRTTFSEAESPKKAIMSLFRGISDDINAGNQRGCMLTACTSELGSEQPRIKDFLVENKERVVASFAALIEGAQQLGEISQDKESRTLALYLFSALQGLRVTSMIEPNLEGVTEQILSIL